MSLHNSRCFTVRPSAAPREQFVVLVIDRSVAEAERVCAQLREDGHHVEVRTYGDDLAREIATLRPQVVAVRMRPVAGSRAALAFVQRHFAHLHVLSFNGSNQHRVREKLPAHWTDIYALAAPAMPRHYGSARLNALFAAL